MGYVLLHFMTFLKKIGGSLRARLPCMHQICRILIFHYFITINKQTKNFIKRIFTPSVFNPA
jgi:hypothetical protein